LVIAYVGFIAGAPLAQSLFGGWTEHGAPWRSAPVLVLLAAAALAVPWTTRKPLYCHQLCPHGAAQELIGHFAPRRWRVALPKSFAAGLRWLPGLLLAMVITITILVLPMDLAHLEPFDAYSFRAAGVATVTIALIGLVASLFVPMAYCRYGCPTGALLEFIRARGPTDRFGRRDIAALLLVVLAEGLAWKYQSIHAWITAGN
jgi:NosR/NirI family nitrous oxide reductase transcriptional regulator